MSIRYTYTKVIYDGAVMHFTAPHASQRLPRAKLFPILSHPPNFARLLTPPSCHFHSRAREDAEGMKIL